MPAVDDASSQQQQTSISTSPLLSPSEERDSLVCLGSTNKDPRQPPQPTQNPRINGTSNANAADINLHHSNRKRRSSNGSNKIPSLPANPLRQHSTDALAQNFRDNGRAVANGSQPYPLKTYWSKERLPANYEEDKKASCNKTLDSQIAHKKLDYTKQRHATIKRATANYSFKVKQYFYQLLSGCDNRKCDNRFCASSSHKALSLNPDAALVLSIHLASKGQTKFCPGTHELPDSTIIRFFETHMRPSSNETSSPDTKSFLSQLFTSASSFQPVLYSNEDPKVADDADTSKVAPNNSHTEEDHTNIPYSMDKSPGTTLYDDPFPDRNIQKLPSQVREFWGNVSAGVLSAINGNRRPLNEFEYHDERGSWWKPSRRTNKYEKFCGPRQNKTHVRTDECGHVQYDDEPTPSSPNTDLIAAAVAHKAIGLRQFKTEFEKMSATDCDDTFKLLIDNVKQSFQHWDGLGNSFLDMNEESSSDQRTCTTIVNRAALSEFYHLLAASNKKNAHVLLKTASQSLEMLLTRLILNCEHACQYQATAKTIELADEPDEYFDTHKAIKWCRSIVYAMQWYLDQKQSNITMADDAQRQLNELKTSTNDCAGETADCSTTSTIVQPPVTVGEDILMQKLVTILSKISGYKSSALRAMLLDSLQSFDEESMSAFIKVCHTFLDDHYHSSPFKLGEDDHVIRSAKALELLYDANQQHPNNPIVPVSTFYNDSLNRILDVKDEYRIWKRVQLVGEGRHSASSIVKLVGAGKTNTFMNLNESQRRTRLFLTTTSTSVLLPFPLMHEYQFSIFSYPFLLPPPLKRKILHIDAMAHMSSEYEDACVNHTLVAHAQRLLSDSPKMVRNLETSLRSATCPYLLLEIHRDHFVEDTWQQITRRWADLKKPLKVRFVGGGEEGMDQGGVQKEFFGVLMEHLIHSPAGLFEVDPDTRSGWISANTGVFNETEKSLDIDEETRRSFEMFGVLMGLAIYNGIILGLQFPKVFWKVLTCASTSQLESGQANDRACFTIEDLEEGWPSLGKGLRQLLEWENDDVEDIFCRSYEISYRMMDKVVSIPLIPDGENTPVTNENRKQFVDDYCRHFMYTWVREPILAIRRGVWSIIGGSAVAMCTADELEVVACGQRDGLDGLDLDMKELEEVAEYDDGYEHNHTVIRHFWSIVHELSPQHKRQLLLFVTASDRVPVGGLKELMFVIQRNGPDSDRLPTALTCFSRLLLPEYSSREKLKDRLLVSIENAKGFGLV
ncbi:hypothetical protein INT43_003555 [Umbelopsis isabellina]|uniref:HECT-type E3 ubiquitin transferase n=1 Tax=Mortierella isabellina TaxID=91625 RepID=A0A8H7PT05_MORIS|nr:hypothetical protein INT43_003555 [Umbelopsis isabellina]